MSGRRLAVLLIAATALRLLVAALIPLTPDEAYYWVWSRALAPGYLDHPPMVALWIRAGTLLLGTSGLGIRLLGPLSALGGSALLYRAGNDLAGPGAGSWAVLLLNATLLFGVGAVTMTPDTPLLFFWTATLWATGRLIATGRPAWWLAIGALTGLALCSKYTAALLPLGLCAWLLWGQGQRKWLAHPVAWLGALLAATSFAPVMWWNARHGWASLLKQGDRNAVFQPARLLSHVGELLGGQAGLVTPLIFMLCIAGIAVAAGTAMRQREPRVVLLVCLTLPACAIFVWHALGDRVQANWPAIIYPAAAVAACRLTAPALRRLFVPGVVLGAVLTMLVYLQTVAAPFDLSRHIDPSLRLAGGADVLAVQVQALARQQGARFVAVDEYGSASLLALLGPVCIPVIGIEPRWALFELSPGAPAMVGRPGLLLRSARRRGSPSMQDWASLVPVATLTRSRNGRFADRYDVYRGIGRAGTEPTALLPCRPE